MRVASTATRGEVNPAAVGCPGGEGVPTFHERPQEERNVQEHCKEILRAPGTSFSRAGEHLWAISHSFGGAGGMK